MHFQNRAYYKKDSKKTLPSKIIIYRDGVSAGDIATLKDGEIKSIGVRNITNYYTSPR